MTRERIGELLRFAAMLLAFWLAMTFWSFNGIARVMNGAKGITPWIDLLTAPIVTGLLMALLSPPIVGLVERFPVAAPHRLRNFALLLVAAVILSLLHGLLMSTVWVGWSTVDRPEFWRRVWVNARSSVTLFGLAVLLAHLVYVRTQAAERERRRVELETLLTRTQTEALRGRLSAPFLFGALDEIIGTIGRDREEAERLLIALSQLLRGVMDLDHEQAIPLSDELDLIDHYVELQPESMALVLDVDEPARRAAVPPFVLQTFVAAMIPVARDAMTIRARLDGRLQLTVSTDARETASEAAPQIASQLQRLFNGQYAASLVCDGASLVGELRL